MKDGLIAELEKGIDTERSERTQHYFGIFPGGYGEGDILLGIPCPYIRRCAKSFNKMPLAEVESLLQSTVHEYRFAALAIMKDQYRKNSEAIIRLYLDNLDHINNWDLVDCFASHLIGRWCLETHDEDILRDLNRAKDLWRRRISLVAYLAFYRKGVLGNSLENIDNRIEDSEDLMHKACGWMLREIYSKVDKHIVESYLIDNYSRMSRTTIRYAIEHMPEDQRLRYLHGDF
jgi:3-methyladenine DNA glycosylase AlkD